MQNLKLSKLQLFMTQVSGWSAVALVFSAPFSRALFTLAGLFFVIGWLSQSDLKGHLKIIRSLQITLPALIITLIVLLWSTWSPAPKGNVINNLKVYAKLPMLLMLVSTFSDARWRQRAWWGFVAAMALVLGSTYANVVIDLPWSRTQNQGLGADHSVFVEYVSQSVMTAVFLAFTLQRTLSAQDRIKVLAWAGASLLALCSVVFLLQGRSGLVASAIVVLVLGSIYTPVHRRWQALVLLVIMSSLLIMASPLMMQRIQQGYHEVVHYQAFNRTSLGLRIDMWQLALKSFIDHPLIGTGSGTYNQIAAQHFGDCRDVCIHPHNQYLFFAMEFGVLGLLGFLWLLWRLAKTAFLSRSPERSVLFAITAVLAVDSLFNVPLWYRAESYFFYAMLGLLVAANLPQAAKAGQHLRPDNLMKS